MTPSKVTEPLDDGAVQMARIRVLLAGICTFIVTVGGARFSYTSLLPVMQAETWLTEASAGWLAASIYIGYMCGVLLAASTNSLARKYYFLRLYLVLSVLTSWGMALSDDIIVWSMLRFVAGICGSGALILASGLILKWLIKNGHRGELGVHFAGAGVSIVGTALLVEWMAGQSMSWQSQWIGFSVMAAIFAIPAWLWMPHPGEDHAQQNGAAAQDKAPARAFFLLMLAAYFCAGYGYVVSATFIVDIVERQDGLAGQGQMIFMWIGIAAIPAVIIWDRVARRVGYIRALVMAYLLQVVGIVMPAFTDSMAGAVFSALLFGGTFIACVSLVLTMAGHMYPSNPAKMMGKMTLAYGVAQILAPMLTGVLAREMGDYYLGLYLAAGVVFAGSLLLVLVMGLEKKEAVLSAI